MAKKKKAPRPKRYWRRRFGFRRPKTVNIPMLAGFIGGPVQQMGKIIFGDQERGYTGVAGAAKIGMGCAVREATNLLPFYFCGYKMFGGTSFHPEVLMETYGPLVVGWAISKIFKAIGISAKYRQAVQKVPLLNKTSI